MLFLHGYTDSWFSFSTVLDRLPPDIRAIVPSQRGHGDSDRPACCYRLADFAADAVALLDALGVPRATIVGHSMGSFVAQRIAIDAPARVNRLVLIGSGTTIRTAPVLEFHASVRKLTDPVSPAFIRDFQHGTIAKPVPAVFMERVIQESAKLPARVWRDGLDGLVAPDAVNQVERITAETLIVWGDKDAMWSSADQDALAGAIRGSRLVTYKGAGHSPQWEEPERFTNDLLAFFRLKAEATSGERRTPRAGKKG